MLGFDPDKDYPYMQKTLAEKLEVSPHDLYALIWYYQMKGNKKYSISVTLSRAGKPSYKFSGYALKFLESRCKELRSDESEYNKIRAGYKSRKQ